MAAPSPPNAEPRKAAALMFGKALKGVRVENLRKGLASSTATLVSSCPLSSFAQSRWGVHAAFKGAVDGIPYLKVCNGLFFKGKMA